MISYEAVLSQDEKDKIVMNNIKDYLETHTHKLEKLFLKASEEPRSVNRDYRELLEAAKGKSEKELWEMFNNNLHSDKPVKFSSYITLMKYFSTLQNNIKQLFIIK